MSAVRFVLGCSKYLNQEIYFGGYNAYVFEPDFTYGGESDSQKAIVNYVQETKANSVSINGKAVEGFESNWYSYAVEVPSDIIPEDFTADVRDFSRYSAEISEDGKTAVLTVESHSFSGLNEYGVYPNKGAYSFALTAPDGFSVKSTKLTNDSGATAPQLAPGSYTLKVSVENSNGIAAKLFAVLYDTSCQKAVVLKIKDVQTDVSDYEFDITVPEGENFELGVFASDDLKTPVALTPFVSVAKTGAAAATVNLLTAKAVCAVQNMNTYTVDASAELGSSYAVNALAIATERGSEISEGTITYAKVMRTSNGGRLDFAFTPVSDGEYTLYVSNAVSGQTLHCDFGYYGKKAVDKAAQWFETADDSAVKKALAENESLNGVPVKTLLGDFADDVASVEDLSYIASSLSGRKFADYKEFQTVLGAVAEESIICESFKKADAEALDTLVEKYGEKSDINLDKDYGYNAFDEEQKESIVKAIKSTPYTSSEELFDVINEAIMLEVFNSYAWGRIEGALAFFKNDIEADMSDFNRLSSNQKTAVLKGMAAASYDEPEDIPDELSRLVGDQKNTGSSGGGGGGGGKSSSGFNNFYSTDATVVPSVPDQPVHTPNLKFADVPHSHWANPYVEDLTSRGIVSGDGNGLFYPERSLTRAEYVKMAVLAFGLYDENAKPEFTDCTNGEWYDSYVASGVNAGIISGMGDGSFAPNSFITRQDMAVIAERCLRASGKNVAAADSGKFTDDALIADYAKSSVYSMKAMNIINGMGDGSFNPSSNATRAMAAKVIDLLIRA